MSFLEKYKIERSILMFKSYIKSRTNYLFCQQTKIIASTEQKKFFKRIAMQTSAKRNVQEVILTTYFTSKRDPQSKAFVASNDFSYISNLYESVITLDLQLVIFHDHLSTDFIAEYSCQNVTFILSNLGDYSLNDERFFIYKEYIEATKPTKVILSDVNDVVIRKNAFTFIRRDILYIGRDEHVLVADNPWIIDKINKIPDFEMKNLPQLFMGMPLVNAGVIGGDYKTMTQFLNKLCCFLAKIDNGNNNNMAAVNFVFFDEYWLPYHRNWINKVKYLRIAYFTNLRNRISIVTKKFFMGWPFTSHFKKYEENNEAFIYHK